MPSLPPPWKLSPKHWACVALLVSSILPGLLPGQTISTEIQRSPAFRGAELKALAARRLAHERRQPLQPALLAADADRPQQRRAAQGSWRTHLNGSGVAPQVFGRGAADRPRRRHLRHHGRRRRVRVVRRDRRDPVAVPRARSTRASRRSAAAGRAAASDGRRQDLRRPARRQARGARSAHRRGGLVDASRALAGRVLDHERAALLRRHGDHGVRGRRDRACAAA